MRTLAIILITAATLALSCGDGPTGPAEPKALIYATLYDGATNNRLPYPWIYRIACGDDDARWYPLHIEGNADGTCVVKVWDMPGYNDHIGHTIYIYGDAEGQPTGEEKVYGFGRDGFPEIVTFRL